MRLGIIGGSGVYQLPGLEDAEWREVETPWGRPSDALLFGRWQGRELVFLPRHGRGHPLAPAEVPYRANIAALKIAGCTDLLSVTACGSFKEELAPGSFVFIDQLVDRTRGRARSFFGEGIVAHVSFGEPICGRLSGLAADAAEELDLASRRGGSLVVIEGPAFSTIAESRLYKAAGLDVIGMTAMPEAALAREAELCYAAAAMVTDYDAWHEAHGAVDVAQVLAVLKANAEKAQRLLAELIRRLPQTRERCPHGCDRALDHAIITARSHWPEETVERLRTIAGRVLG